MINEIIYLFSLCLTAFGYSWFEGKREAWYDHEILHMHTSGETPDKRNEHLFYTIQRMCFYFMLFTVLASFKELSFTALIKPTLITLGVAFQFSFFHNWSYMYERNRLAKIHKLGKPYPRGIFDMGVKEKENGIEIELSFISRILLLIIGIVFLILSINI